MDSLPSIKKDITEGNAFEYSEMEKWALSLCRFYYIQRHYERKEVKYVAAEETMP
jgi:hypothetical protein